MITSSNKIIFFSIYIIVILFLSLFFMLSFHSRIAGDDFYYLWLRNSFGAWDGMLFQYRHWSGRWSAHLIGCVMISYWRNPIFLPFINILTLGSLFLSLKLASEKIFHSININPDRKIIPAFILLFITTFFFASYSIGETWFWYIIILTYLWSIIAFIFLLDVIFSKNTNILNFLFIIFCCSYIGGSSESFALIFMSILIAIFIYRVKYKKPKQSDPITNKLIYSLVLIGISFSFSAFAPGTEIRHSLLPHTTFIDKTLILSKSYIKYFLLYLPGKFPYLFIFSFPWIYFGAFFLKNTFEKNSLKKILTKTSLIFLISLAIMLIPTSLVMSEAGPDRALSIISLLTTAFFAIIFSIAGAYINTVNKHFKKILSVVSLVTILFLLKTIYFQFNITEKFSLACDERLNYLESAFSQNFKGILEIEKIPYQGMLYWDEISLDTSYFTNKHLKEGLSLPFAVKLKE